MRMATFASLFLLVAALQSGMYLAFAMSPCASFHFPGQTGNNITVAELTKVVVPFSVNHSSCGRNPFRNTTISVTKSFGDYSTLCTFLHSSGKCHGQGPCSCPADQSEEYHITFPPDRSFAGRWELSAGSSKVENATIFFIVTYKPKIDKLLFFVQENQIESTVDLNSSVTVVCSLDKGVPPVPSTLRLIDHRGQMLPANQSDDQGTKMTHTIERAACDDMGNITCHIENGSSTTSRLLLVRCAPDFSLGNKTTWSFSSAEKAIVAFPVRTYNKDITKCQLSRLQTATGSASRDEDMKSSGQACDGFYNLTGTPPVMTFQLNLSGMTSTPEGFWRLEVANHAGSGYFNFTIEITESRKINTSPNTTTVVAVSFCVSVVIVASIGTSIICHRLDIFPGGRNRRRSSSRSMRALFGRRKNKTIPRVSYRGSNVSLTVINDLYEATPGSLPQQLSAQQDIAEHSARGLSVLPPPCGAAVWPVPPCAVSRSAGLTQLVSLPDPFAGSAPSEQFGVQQRGSASEEEGDYAEIEDNTTSGAHRADPEVYVDVAEIQRRKRQQRRLKKTA